MKFPLAMIVSGCEFYLNQYLWGNIQFLGLTVDYISNEDIRKTCKQRTALACLPLDLIGDAWIIYYRESYKYRKVITISGLLR